MASFFVFGSGCVLNAGLRVLTKSRRRSASMCASRNARSGGVLSMSFSSIAMPASARNLLAFWHVVQVGLQ